MEVPSSPSPPLRVALEGCGHGCLNDIYASVEKSAALKGWDGVDLLIIGGDFQAVRNSNDMACMSVPTKYKELGDFHEYYSGKRTAPYLTIFIGGNHEAGNHLFELYYGGWVAPNIYYMGAANVLRCGPLRIAGMSGIWKGYDYRKPHMERLPYNHDDIQSIYHVRELDIRKLLQIRTQVDLGLSHDWPKQVEYSGDYETLFRIKRGFRQDSQEGKFGNVAAKYVLDRLRPAYWFSAHLHVKFAASIHHGEYRPYGRPVSAVQTADASTGPSQNVSAMGMDGAIVSVLKDELEAGHQHTATQPVEAQPTEAQPKKTVPETPSQDATAASGPQEPVPEATVKAGENSNETAPEPQTPQQNLGLSAWQNFHAVASKDEAAENSRFLSEQEQTGAAMANLKHNLTWRKVDVDTEGAGRRLTGVERTHDGEPRDSKKQKTQHESAPVKNADEIDLDLDSDSDQDTPANAAPQSASKPATQPAASVNQATAPKVETSAVPQPSQSGVSDDVRNQLPASFMRPKPAPEPINGPLPKAISNTRTDFLALDKCLPNRDFLQLVEFPAISTPQDPQCQRPFRLQYDKEWLAITRVFASDLELGDPSAKPSPDKGDIGYKPLIEAEEQWVEENIVKQGKMDVPENFTITAPVYDPAVPITTEEMPIEYTNPQTAQFCELIGIENKFHLSNEERQRRMAAGPRESRPRRGGFGGPGRGRGGGRVRGGGRGRGNRRY